MFPLNWTRKMMSTCGITNAPSLDNGITNHHLTCQYLNGLFFYILSDNSKGTTGEQQGTATRDCMTESYKGQMTDPPIQVVKIRSSDYQKVELSDSKDHTYALYTKKQRVSRTLRCSHYKGTPPSVCFKSGRCWSSSKSKPPLFLGQPIVTRFISFHLYLCHPGVHQKCSVTQLMALKNPVRQLGLVAFQSCKV